jgi:hypothetical protein
LHIVILQEQQDIQVGEASKGSMEAASSMIKKLRKRVGFPSGSFSLLYTKDLTEPHRVSGGERGSRERRLREEHLPCCPSRGLPLIVCPRDQSVHVQMLHERLRETAVEHYHAHATRLKRFRARLLVYLDTLVVPLPGGGTACPTGVLPPRRRRWLRGRTVSAQDGLAGGGDAYSDGDSTGDSDESGGVDIPPSVAAALGMHNERCATLSLIVRHAFKGAAYHELRGRRDKALKHYGIAYAWLSQLGNELAAVCEVAYTWCGSVSSEDALAVVRAPPELLALSAYPHISVAELYGVAEWLNFKLCCLLCMDVSVQVQVWVLQMP